MTRPQVKLAIPTPGTRAKTRGSKKGKATSQSPSRVIVPERGIILTSEKHGEIESWLSAAISDLGWEVFAEPPDQACSEFVTSFLSSFSVEEFPHVTINGVKVAFTEEEINDAYNTISVPTEEDEYEMYCKGRSQEEVADEILSTICHEGSHWEKGESLLRKSLNFECKVWMHFINSRLLPASHDTRVNWERAVLAFCIVKRKKFDIGRIINKQLSASLGTRKPFYFPCLVTEMCKRAGLKPEHSDVVEMIPLAINIDQSTLKRMRENEGEEGSKKEEEEEVEEEEETETIEGESETKKKEEQGEIPKQAYKMPARKTTAGRRKRAEEASTSTAETATLLGMGADLLARQMRNIENMISQELQDVKRASLAIANEKDQLEQELMQIRSQEPPSKKRKVDPTEKKEQGETEGLLRDFMEIAKALKQELLTKEEAHKEERSSWSNQLQSLAERQTNAEERLMQVLKYVRDRDEVMDANWAGKFKG